MGPQPGLEMVQVEAEEAAVPWLSSGVSVRVLSEEGPSVGDLGSTAL